MARKPRQNAPQSPGDSESPELRESPAAYDLAPYSIGRNTLQADLLIGLLREVETRAGEGGKRIAQALAAGQSRSMASLAGGISDKQLIMWCRADRELASLLDSCEQMGVSGVFESELYRRALGGEDDRGSIRALELVLKARRPEYRERSQVQMEIVTRAQESRAQIVSGWDNEQASPE